MLDKSIDAKPLWSQIYSIVLDRIEQEVYGVNELLPTDIDLMEEFDVSRATVRTAMNRLITEGYIRRERGVGSTVIEREDNVVTFLKSSFSDIAEHDRKKDRIILSISQEDVNQEILDFFGIKKNTKVTQIIRLTRSGAKVLSIHRSYINPKIIINNESEIGNSLYKYFTSVGYPITRVREDITAGIMNSEEKEQFETKEDAALMVRERKAYSKDLPVEYNISSYHGEGYVLTIELD